MGARFLAVWPLANRAPGVRDELRLVRDRGLDPVTAEWLFPFSNDDIHTVVGNDVPEVGSEWVRTLLVVEGRDATLARPCHEHGATTCYRS